MAWQKSSGYNQRSRVETQMGRWKAVIAPKLKARHFDNQKTEIKIGVHVLNRMTELGQLQCWSTYRRSLSKRRLMGVISDPLRKSGSSPNGRIQNEPQPEKWFGKSL
jgi:hypothetical protein